MSDTHIGQGKYNFKSFLNWDEVVGRLFWCVGSSSGLDQMDGDSGPPLCRGMPGAQSNGSPVVLLILDSFRQYSLLCHAFCGSTFCLFVHSCILDLRVKKKVSLDYNFVAFEPSLSSKLVLRAATHNGDWFYQTLTPLSKEAFLTDILEMENLMVRFTC